MDYIEIGGVPCNEDCAQTGSGNYDYVKMNRLECNAYIVGLRRKYGEPPVGARFRIHGNSHDFGTYYEVRVTFDDSVPEACEYAYKVESGLATWLEAGLWAPVTYDDKNVVYVIEDPELWVRETNPHSRKTREERDADLANAKEHPDPWILGPSP